MAVMVCGVCCATEEFERLSSRNAMMVSSESSVPVPVVTTTLHLFFWFEYKSRSALSIKSECTNKVTTLYLDVHSNPRKKLEGSKQATRCRSISGVRPVQTVVNTTTQSAVASVGAAPSDTAIPASMVATEPVCKAPPVRGLYHCTL
jgi:hypothetical protein